MLELLEFLLHIDQHLDALLRQYGTLTYALLAAVIFLETGLVITPFLPGDSLLFASGALAARGSLDWPWLILLLSAAAITGNTVNYWIGRLVGAKAFRASSRWFRRDHLERTHRFYERYGGMTIVLTRFLPIFRTFAPFVAGIARMGVVRFLVYNVAGGALWVTLLVFAGYLFGNLPVVRRNFPLVVAGIIVVSLVPAVAEALRHRRRQRGADLGLPGSRPPAE
ncbi:MAG TPA: DedA family protein [bacterium]|nr:DedA family protein [bacterium]